MRQHVRRLAIAVAGALSLSALPAPILGQAPDVVDSSVSREHLQADVFRPAFSGCTIQTFTPVNFDFEQQVVELVNDHRASIGRPPLKRVSLLNQTARYHARDMREDNYFNHDTYDRVGSNLQFVCGWNIRITGHYTSATSLGENIAAGYPTPQSVMSGWLSSSGHRDNIENANHREIGVGYDAGGSYGHYWVQNFGRRADVYPLIINREYSRTAAPNVSVYVYGSWTQMRLRNDGGPWSDWQAFNNSVNWTLNGIQGSREVCAEFTNGSQTLSACDTISLTVHSPPALGVTPGTLSFVYDVSSGQIYPSLPQSVQVSNVGNTGALNWAVSVNQPWLTATPAAGSTLFTVAQVSLVTSALPNVPGVYSGVALFSAPGTSAPVTVTLSVVNSLPFKLRIPVVRRP